MGVTRRRLIAGSTVAAVSGRVARSQQPDDGVIRIGVMTDLSGPYRDLAGPGSIAAVQQAVQEFTAGNGMKVEVISGDFQSKPDVGASLARQWFDDRGVDMVADVLNSAVSLAVSAIAREKNKVALVCPATSEMTGKQCSPNTVHWSHDTWMLANSTVSSIMKSGGDSWFLIAPNYAFGKQLAEDSARFITQGGGKLVGSVAYPFPDTTDFSSYLQQAQASGAKVVGFCTAGIDSVNCIKQAYEFGLNQTNVLAAMLMTVVDLHALDGDTGAGLRLTESFYWDLNDRTRAFTQRMRPRLGDGRPTMFHAGDYAATLHYLKAVADMGVAAAKKDGRAVVERMKAMPTDDDCFGKGTIRADGRKIHPAYLFQVKSSAERANPWDLYKLLATTPADQAFRPLSEGGCPLIHA